VKGKGALRYQLGCWQRRYGRASQTQIRVMITTTNTITTKMTNPWRKSNPGSLDRSSNGFFGGGAGGSIIRYSRISPK